MLTEERNYWDDLKPSYAYDLKLKNVAKIQECDLLSYASKSSPDLFFLYIYTCLSFSMVLSLTEVKQPNRQWTVKYRSLWQNVLFFCCHFCIQSQIKLSVSSACAISFE